MSAFGIRIWTQPPNRPQHADSLLRTPDGGLVLIMFPFEDDANDLVKLSNLGSVAWTYQMPDVQDVRAVEIALLNAHVVQSRHPFGPQQETTTSVSDLLPYTDDYVAAVGRPARSVLVDSVATTSTC